MSALMEWHLGHVVRLIGGRGSGSIPKTMDGNAEVRLSRIAHRIALLDLAQEWKLRKIGAGSHEISARHRTRSASNPSRASRRGTPGLGRPHALMGRRADPPGGIVWPRRRRRCAPALGTPRGCPRRDRHPPTAARAARRQRQHVSEGAPRPTRRGPAAVRTRGRPPVNGRFRFEAPVQASGLYWGRSETARGWGIPRRYTAVCRSIWRKAS